MFDQIITVSLNPSLDVTLWLEGCDWEEPNRCDKEKIYAGGKALNVSRVLKKLEVPFQLMGISGTKNRQMLTELLDADEIHYHFIENEGTIRENLTLMFPEGKLLKVNRAGMPVPRQKCMELLKLLKRETQCSCDCLAVFAGSIPPNVTREEYCELIQQVKADSVKIAIDSDFLTLHDIQVLSPDIIKPNYCEAKRLFGNPDMDDKALHKAMLDLSEIVPHILLSCGKDGVLYYHGRECWHIIVPKVTVRSTVGAGDTTLAGFIAALHHGTVPLKAAIYATACGTASVTLDGTEAITPDMVPPYLAQMICVKV